MPQFLKCDADGCEHQELVEAVGPALIGKPCPKCGANLLTEEDCKNWMQTVLPGVELLLALGLVKDASPQADDATMILHLHKDTLTTKITNPAD